MKPQGFVSNWRLLSVSNRGSKKKEQPKGLLFYSVAVTIGVGHTGHPDLVDEDHVPADRHEDDEGPGQL